MFVIDQTELIKYILKQSDEDIINIFKNDKDTDAFEYATALDNKPVSTNRTKDKAILTNKDTTKKVFTWVSL